MGSPFSNFLGVHGPSLGLREQRLNVLASNLANADTPGYKAKDMDFQTALDAAMQGGDATTAAIVGASTFERPSSQPSLDGNTVDAEREKAAFGQAALEYRATMTFVESKTRSMLTAITGQ